MNTQTLVATFGLSLLMAAGSPAMAQKTETSHVKVSDAWTRPTVPGSKVSASYMKIRVSSPLKLLMAESPAAGQVEIHDMKMMDGVMHMNPAGVIELTPGKTLEMKPGGMHVMLTKVKEPIKAGDPVLIRLTFVGKDNKPFTTTIDARAQDKSAAKK